LKVRVVKSSKAILKIPEFRFESIPGSDAQGYIGSIESLLEEVARTIHTLKKWVKNDQKKNRQLSELDTKLEKARKGMLVFTIILEDPSGNSAILPEPPLKVKIHPLNNAEY